MASLFKKHWKKLVVLVSVICSIYIGFLIFGSSPQGPGITPVPSVNFTLVKTFPLEGDVTLAFPSTGLQFYFSKSLQKDKTEVVTKPDTPINISTIDSDKTLIITPVGSWKFNQMYNFTIKVVSLTGDVLSDIQYSFTPKIPTNSDMTN